MWMRMQGPTAAWQRGNDKVNQCNQRRMGTEDAGTGGGRARGTTKNAIDESTLVGELACG